MYIGQGLKFKGYKHKVIMSESGTSKALVERREAGAVATAPRKQARKRPIKKALEEEEFTEALTTIVRRDFFPDVPKLEAQLEFIEASENNDYVRLRAISERFATTQQTPQPAAATPATFETPSSGSTPREPGKHPPSSSFSSSSSLSEAPNPKRTKPEDTMGLDQFLSKHQSEDDAAFSDIMEKTKEQQRAKHEWLYEKEREYTLTLGAPEELLAITDGSEGGAEGGRGGGGGGERKVIRRSGVKSWTYTAKNSLMYYPEGVERSVKEMITEPGREKKVVHSNTRLSSSFVKKMHGALKCGGEGEGGGERGRDKVGVDGKVIDPLSSPQVNGYGFVATPQIQPGVDASPLMTWGSIEGTPLRLDTDDITPGHGPTFKMPKIPKREAIAHQLADRVTKSARDRKKFATHTASPSMLRQRLGTPATPTERLNLLSPAAQKLASRTATPSGSAAGRRGAIDVALRQSYSPQHTTPHATPTHTGSRSGTTPGQRHTPHTPATDDGSSTPSLTDNLLNLKNR